MDMGDVLRRVGTADTWNALLTRFIGRNTQCSGQRPQGQGQGKGPHDIIAVE
jgi:hypothetical protein